MGRRSQKSRTGQPKDRGKRAVSDSEIPDANAGKPSEAESADSANGDDSADKPFEAVNAENANDDETPDKPSAAESAENASGDDSADMPSEAGNADKANGDETADKSSDAMHADELDGDDAHQDNVANVDLECDSADDIAAGYASIDADQNPQTCCSNCKTIFEVSPELLSSSDTRVRCGECLGIFDALANLRRPEDKEGDEFTSGPSGIGVEKGGEQADAGSESRASDGTDSQDASENGMAANDTSLDVTYADFSLFSADAALPEIDYLDETREVPDFDFDDPGEDGELDETYCETLFAHGPEVDARSAINETDTGYVDSDESAASGTRESSDGNPLAAGQTTADDTVRNVTAPLSVNHTNDELDELDELVGSLRRPESFIRVEESPVSSWRLKSSLFFLVLTLSAALYAYRERESLQHNRSLRPALETLCSVIGCTLAEPVDLASLRVLKRSVFSHPKLNNVLVINIGFVNQATFDQRFPVIEIRLTDRNGALVVKNSFKPSNYLDNWKPGDVLDAGKKLDISLNVDDPGNKAISFELDFR